MNKQWWHEGIQFECQGSGKCCVSHGGYGSVYLTLEDRQRLARHLNLSTKEFTKEYCVKSDQGIWRIQDLDQNCRFLKNKQCSVYAGRPTQCRTWPFWPEVMNARTWAKDVKAFCPGVGKGRVWSAAEIEKQLQIQRQSEQSLVRKSIELGS